MFSRLITPFVAVFLFFTAFAVAMPWHAPASSVIVTPTRASTAVTGSQTGISAPSAGDPKGTCTASDVTHCCEQTQAPHAVTPGGILDLSDVLGSVGTGCTPTANLASTCKSQPVCCKQGASTSTLANVQVGCVTL